MIRTSIGLALLLASVTIGTGCAKNPPANANTPPEASPGMRGAGTMGPGMMGADSGMMGPGMMGSASGMAGPGMMNMMAMGDQCPMTVPGTTVMATEMADGMSMTFTTTGDIGELRKRARAMADHVNGQSSGAMGAHGMMMGVGMGSGMQGMMGVDGGPEMMHGGGIAPGIHGAMMGSCDAGGGMMMSGMMASVRAQVEDVPAGARLRMTPVDPSRLGEMKQHMQQHSQMMNQSHSCPMMGSAR